MTTATVTDSVVFRRIFSTSECAAIWSDEGRTQCYLSIEAALAKVQAQLGIIPDKAAHEIKKACNIAFIDWDELREQTEIIGYPVLGMVKQIVKRVNGVEPGLGEWAHWGATTQDITDTATVMQLRETLKLVEAASGQIIHDLTALVQKYKDTPMVARSNLQQAVPMTFGFKMARLLATYKRHQARLVEIRRRVCVLEFSGAAGTLASLAYTGKGMECQAALAKELGLEVPEIAWHTERDRIAEVGGLFAMLTATCAKFALDVKLMMQTEVGEVSEPFVMHRGSSSTMPQKRNPIGSVYITAMASTVRQLSASLYEAMVEDHERSTGPWEIEWIVLPQISTLTHATLIQTGKLTGGLEVHPDAMKHNLELTKGAIVSENVMMGLGCKLGRQFAHDLVYEFCQKAAQERRPLLEFLIEDENISAIYSREELEQLCDPSSYLGLSVEMADRILRDS